MILKVIFAFSFLLLGGCSNETQVNPLNADDVILSFGDSLTVGVGANKHNSYPQQLQKLVTQKVISAGISGEQTSGSLQRIEGVLNQYHPALVILCIGGNDFLRKKKNIEVANNIEKLIKIIENNDAKVLLIAVPEPSIFLSPSPIYSAIAIKHELIIIEDKLTDLLSNNNYKSDGIHLNDKGYKLLAEEVFHTMLKAGFL